MNGGRSAGRLRRVGLIAIAVVGLGWLVFQVAARPASAIPAVNTWTDGAFNQLWSSAANWSLGHVPTATEVAQFDGLTGPAGSSSVIVDQPTSVGGVNVLSSYTNSISVAANLNIVTSGGGGGSWNQAGGSLSSGGGSIVVQGDWNFSGTSMGLMAVDFEGVATEQLHSNGQVFGSLSHGGSSTVMLQDSLTVNGMLTNGGGSMDANGHGIATGQLALNAALTNASTLHVVGSSQVNVTAIATSSTQTYDGPVTLGADTNLSASTATFNSTVVGSTHALTVTGNATFNNTLSGLTTLHVTGSAAVNTGSATASGTQAYDGAVTLGVDANLVGSTVTFGSSVTGGHALTVGGAGVFGNTVSGLSTLHVTGTANVNTGTMSTLSTQVYDGAATLGVSAVMTGTTVTFNSAVSGGSHALTVSAAAVFNNTVTTLTTLHVFSTATINTAGVSSSGTQNYDGAVGLGADTNLNGSTVTFGSTVSGGARNLTVTGNAVLAGGVSSLNGIHVTGGASINGGGVSSAGSQAYDGASNLGSNATLTGSTISFGNGLNGGSHQLVVNGNAVFGGNTSAIASLNISGGYSLLSGAVFTAPSSSGNFQVGGNWVNAGTFGANGGTLNLNGGAPQTLTSGGATFNNLIDNSAALSLQDDLVVSGSLTVNQAMNGNGHNVTAVFLNQNATFTGSQSLHVTSSSAINAANLSATTTVSLDGSVNLGTNPTIAGTTITFGSGVTGNAHALVVTGNALFAGATSGLGSLSVSGSFTLPLASSFGAPTTFTVGGDWTNSGGAFAANGGTVVFNGGAQNLTSGGATFNNLTHSGAGVLVLQDDLTVIGNWTNSGGGFNANGHTVTFNGAAQSVTSGGTAFNNVTHNGSGNLTLLDDLNVSGTLNNNVGGLNANNHALLAGVLSLSAAFFNGSTLHVTGTSAFNISAVQTSGTQVYDGTVTLGVNTNVSASSVTFNGGLTGNSHQLAISGDAVFGGTTSGISSLQISQGSFTLKAGATFTAPPSGGTFALNYGNWTNLGGVFNANGGTMVFNSGSTEQLTTAGAVFNNLTHSGAGSLLLRDNLTVAGALLNNAGALFVQIFVIQAGSFGQSGAATLYYAIADDGSVGQLQVSGPASLGGTLAVTMGVAPAKGTVLDIVKHTAGGTSGTFAGLPEGKTFTPDSGDYLTISYVGGAGHQDVVLTVDWSVLRAPNSLASPNNFFFGGSCPRNTNGAVTACYLVGDSENFSTQQALGGRLFRGALTANSSVPGAWDDVTPAGVGSDTLSGISCVDTGTTATPNVSCYIAESSGKLTYCQAVSQPSRPQCADGADWTTVAASAQPLTFYGISCPDQNDCAMVGSDNVVMTNTSMSTTPGTWTFNNPPLPDITPNRLTPPQFLGVTCPTVSHCYAGGYGGEIYHGAISGGAPWSAAATTNVPAGEYVNAVSCSNLNTGDGTDAAHPCYAATDGRIVQTIDGGVNWTLVVTSPQQLFAIACSDLTTAGNPGFDCSAGGTNAGLMSYMGTGTWSADNPVTPTEIDGSLCSKNGTVSFCWAFGNNLLLARRGP